MFVAAGHHDREVRLTLEAAVELANARTDPPETSSPATEDLRRILVDHGFTRAPDASAAALRRLADHVNRLQPRLRSLADPDLPLAEAVDWVNAELAAVAIEPWLTSHHGAPLHLHWTRPTATFDVQIVADVLMALAQELADHGTARFGTCAAHDCEHLFYDATRNRSRRFCSDPRCASRTHTADHRARQRGRRAPA